MAETKTERSRRLARERYEWIGKAACDRVREYTGEDFVFYPMNSIRIEGVDEFIRYESSNMDAFPGFHTEMIHLVGDGDRVALHWIFEGDLPEDVHEWLGVKTTERHSCPDVICFVRFNEEGRICEKHAKYNMLQNPAQPGNPEAARIASTMQKH